MRRYVGWLVVALVAAVVVNPAPAHAVGRLGTTDLSVGSASYGGVSPSAAYILVFMYNRGPDAASDVQLVVDGVSPEAVLNQAQCGRSGNRITCPIGSVDPGPRSFLINLALCFALVPLTVSVSTTDTDTDPGNNSQYVPGQPDVRTCTVPAPPPVNPPADPPAGGGGTGGGSGAGGGGSAPEAAPSASASAEPSAAAESTPTGAQTTLSPSRSSRSSAPALAEVATTTAGSGPLLWGSGSAVVVLVAAGAGWWLRRRRARLAPAATD